MERRTSFTCTRRRATASSTMTGRHIVRRRRLTAGRNSSPSSKSTLGPRARRNIMCTGIVETAEVSGSGKGPQGWFKLEQVNVSYDHPTDAQLDDALNIDFVNEKEGPSARVAVELSPESARKLVEIILTTLSRRDPGTSQREGV